MLLFGKKKKAPAPKLGDSIQKLRATSNTLDKHEKHLSKQIQKCLIDAKLKAAKKDKRGALFQLKRKKMFEKQLNQIYGKKSNLETQIMALENAASNKDLFAAFTEGKNALKAAVNENDIERMEETLEDIQESMSLVDDMSEAMAQEMGDTVDEDELEEDFLALENELAEEAMLALNAPDVPTNTISVPDVAVEDEPGMEESSTAQEQTDMKQLEALMGL